MPDYHLYRGAHSASEDKLCAMEWAARLAGEQHSDDPECVDSRLAKFCRVLNDSLDDEPRQKLRPYLTRCIGTANDGMADMRGAACLDWFVRAYLPAWLDAAELPRLAESLHTLPEIKSLCLPIRASGVLENVRSATYSDPTTSWVWGSRGGTAREVVTKSFRELDSLTNATQWYPEGVARAYVESAAEFIAFARTEERLHRSTVDRVLLSAVDLLGRMLPTIPLDLEACEPGGTCSDWEAFATQALAESATT